MIFRTNIQMSGLVEQLMVYNVPFVMKDSVPNIYEHWIAKAHFCLYEHAFGSNAGRIICGSSIGRTGISRGLIWMKRLWISPM